MMKKIICFTLLVLILGSYSAASYNIDVDRDFYTPMSTMVTPDRTYLLTSTAHAWIDMGSGPESFETVLFLKFDPNSLPDAPVERAWLRMASGASATMGLTNSRPALVSVHNVDLDVEKIVNYTVTPRDFYVHENHILESFGRIFVFKDGVCYWDITELVNSWILYAKTDGQEGIENLGLALTGREDAGANDPDDNDHPGFWSSRASQGANPMPHSTSPVMIITEQKDGFGDAWIPDWRGNDAYTHQHWLFSASQGRCEQGMLPDGTMDNIYGDPNVVWQEETQIGDQVVINPFLTWHPFVDQSEPNHHPAWVDGVYGGLFRGTPYAEHALTATVPTGSQPGNLMVFVQYDWYEGGQVDVLLDGAVDITPANIESFKIGNGDSLFNWYRSTKVFSIDQNPGVVHVEFVVSGQEPFIDAVSVTTAINGDLPDGSLRIKADINMDGLVNYEDFSIIADHWNQPGDSLKGDCDDSGTINFDDLLDLIEQWCKESNYIF